MKTSLIERFNSKPMTSLRLVGACLLALATTSSLASDAGERKFIWKGMGEGEVVPKIGKPDPKLSYEWSRANPKRRAEPTFPMRETLRL